jgi:uncharacterized membrane protein
MRGLGDLPGGRFASTAYAVSADGAVIVGQGVGAAGPEAALWRAGAMAGLGDLPGGAFFSEAFGVSADGTTVVGLLPGSGGVSRDVRSPASAIFPAASQGAEVSADGSVVVGKDESSGLSPLERAP